MQSKENRVHFEAVLQSKKRSMFAKNECVGPDNLDEFTPAVGTAEQAAKALKSLNFRVRHVGTFSISADGPRWLWERVFKTKVKRITRPLSKANTKVGKMSYWSHKANTPFSIHKKLRGLVERAYPQPPPIVSESPLPPKVGVHHLNVATDVAMILRATLVHSMGVTGRGVLIAMPDTGFYKHPFYAWHGYNYNRTLSPDAKKLELDELGHGTAQAANVFATAPNVEFVGIKYNYLGNSTLAFKIACDLQPAVINISWGHPTTKNTLPKYLKPLEAAIIEAVRKRGIVVCCAAGNWGDPSSFPAQMPEVIAVGGVYASGKIDGDDFNLEASNYANSYDSLIYPGRHVPDVCGLVGMQPRGNYIMLPTQPKSIHEIIWATGNALNMKDGTTMNDGWVVTSGTSAASPQVAGICALLKEVQPELSPRHIKAILRTSARDVKKGKSATGQPAGESYDGATGAGLVDAFTAYRLARSVNPYNFGTSAAL
jgi:hypothetical protein